MGADIDLRREGPISDITAQIGESKLLALRQWPYNLTDAVDEGLHSRAECSIFQGDDGVQPRAHGQFDRQNLQGESLGVESGGRKWERRDKAAGSKQVKAQTNRS